MARPKVGLALFGCVPPRDATLRTKEATIMPRYTDLHATVRRRARAVTLAAIEPVESRLLLSAGALDTTFGSNGTVETGFGGVMNSGAQDAVLQSDGKIVV